MTYRELIRQYANLLTPKYGTEEAKAMVLFTIDHYKGWSTTDRLVHLDDEVSEIMFERMEHVSTRLLAGHPLQYILGVAPFHGMTLQVNESTLIPRPETSQLVDIVSDRLGNRADLKVLDIGTGSGAIAIALARALRFPVVEAIDISAGALDVARANARDCKVRIDFNQGDILSMSLKPECYDLIISNPPYITVSERPTMSDTVAMREPSSALFVPDDDPMLFYRAISRQAHRALVNGALLAFEINSRFGREVVATVAHAGFSDIELIKDYKGNDRFVLAVKQGV